MCNHAYYMNCIIIICKDLLRIYFVARCLCSYTTSRHIIMDPDSPIWQLIKCQSVNQSDLMLHRRIVLNFPLHPVVLCLICYFLLWQGFLNQPFISVYQFTCLFRVVYFSLQQLLNTLSSKECADIHETIKAFIF